MQMSHYAKIEDGIVTDVIVAEQDFIDTLDGTWLQTSYNTRGGVHYNPETGEPDDGIPLRKNFASLGHTYDSERDAFIPPKAYDSFVLNEDTCIWEPPVPYPTDGKRYRWREETLEWKEYVLPDEPPPPN
jgi:hypothetical protein